MSQLDSELFQTQAETLKRKFGADTGDLADEPIHDDIDADLPEGTRQVVFEVVWKRIGGKRTVPVAPGAGTKAAKCDMAVSVRSILDASERDMLVSASAPSELGDCHGQTYLLSGLVGDVVASMSPALTTLTALKVC